MRCMPLATEGGASIWMTRSTAPMSMPSSSVEVAQRARIWPAFNCSSMTERCARGERAVMGAGDRLAGQLVQRAGQPLGHLAAVDEENGRVALANDLQQARMNRIPDGDAARHLRGRAAGNLLLLAEARHVFNRNFNAQLQLLGRAGVDDGDGTIAEGLRSSAETGVRRAGSFAWFALIAVGFLVRLSAVFRSPLRRESAQLLPAAAAWRRGRCAARAAW